MFKNAETKLPLSMVQQGIYFDSQIDHPVSYNVSATILLAGKLNEKHFVNAIKLLIAEQDALRSVLELENDVPSLVIKNQIDFDLSLQDISGSANATQELKTLIQAEISQPFDLFKPPLFRFKLIKLEVNKYLFIVCVHHIIFDGMSLNILLSKILNYYHKLVNHQEFMLKKDSGFTNFIERENAKLKSGEYNKQKKYWLKKLQGATPPILPGLSTALYADSGAGKEKRFPIPNKLFASISKLSSERQTTIFSFFLSAFAVLIKKYVSSNDIIFGSPFTFRPETELEETLGLFVYMLPLRFAITEDITFSAILEQGTQELINVYSNIGYPNNLILRDNHLVSSTGRASIFDISFVYDVFDAQNANGLKAKFIDQDIVTFAGNLMVILTKTGKNHLLKFQYKTSGFPDATIELLGWRFLKLLESITNNINLKISEIDLMLPKEKYKILNEFKYIPHGLPRDKSDESKQFNSKNFSSFALSPKTLIDVFDEKVKLFQSRVALITANQKITYRDVNAKANQLARKILASVKTPNANVGIQIIRSIDLVIAILAVLKARCAYVPIDPLYPHSRKEFIFKDADVSLLITSRDLLTDKLADISCIFVDDEGCFGGSEDNLPIKPDPFTPAYIIYTSGSTGNPKGIKILHRSVVNTLQDLEKRFPVTAEDVFLFKTSFTFDIAATEIFGWFFGEGSLYILEPGAEKDPGLIFDAIAKNRITHINFVPTLFRPFLELCDDKLNIAKLNSLKWIFVGGEPFSKDLLYKFNSLNVSASLENMYGPTECTIWCATGSLKNLKPDAPISIGYPLSGTRWYVVGNGNQLLPIGIVGELCVSGIGLAQGYLNLPQLTQERFVPNPFYSKKNDPDYFKMMYQTGDLARWLPDGSMEFIGRVDLQVKIQGVRVELGEIENIISRYDGVTNAVVVAKEENNKPAVLCAFYLAKNEIVVSKLRNYLAAILPSYMIPSLFIAKKDLPLNSSGKVDRKALLHEVILPETSQNYVPPASDLEKLIAQVWQEVLGNQKIGLDDNFFEVGGHSILVMQVYSKLKKIINRKFTITKLFQFPTIRLLAGYFSENTITTVNDRKSYFKTNAEIKREDIAIIGLSLHVPGADTVDEFWKNLSAGKESIHFYSDEELRDMGVSEEVISSQNYIKARGRINNIDYFDSSFFDYTPSEARILSPQLRILYQGAWEALEDAGYYPGSDLARIGTFLGSSDDFEWYNKIFFVGDEFSSRYQNFILNTNHFLATRIAYKLDLKGPAYSALTGCSTTLVTSHLACQALLMRECDMAIAGGITIELPNEGGYFYEEGMMFSADGHCCPFAAKATGTMFSNGMGLVVLKRLSDAIKDNDHIYAVIKSSAINNDGKQKAGFVAPSVEGQAKAIVAAYKVAGIDPETVTFVEGHGTGTLLGDPIEVESLTKAFASHKKQFCVLGSVKGNVGHTDTAAGVVSLIKVALSLEHKYIPGTVNFENPNPRINFADTPFVVKANGMVWENANQTELPRRAGINSFGIGGTNAHMILEEFIDNTKSADADGVNILVFSALTLQALQETSKKILEFIFANPSLNLSDVAWVLQVGRKAFCYRKFLVVNENFYAEKDTIIKSFTKKVGQKINSKTKDIYFMFPGQGSQYLGMGRGIYFESARSQFSIIFKKYIDQVFSLLSAKEQVEFKELMYGSIDQQKINQTEFTQFALFATSFALASALIELGITPKGMLGHSIGEVTAAAVAGVFSLEDAVKIVRLRGQLMQQAEPGIMLVVKANRQKLESELNSDVWLALENTTNSCVVAGSVTAIEQFENKLTKIGWEFIRVRTSHAFHTPMMAKAANEFQLKLATFKLSEPKIPIISNISGAWVTTGEMTDPKYWSKHILNTVNFAKSLTVALKNPDSVFIEVGAGNTLSTFAMQHEARLAEQQFVNLLRHPREVVDDVEYVNEKLAQIWAFGVNIDWLALKGNKLRKRVSLPTYVFDPTHYPLGIPVDIPFLLRKVSVEHKVYTDTINQKLATSQLPSSKSTISFKNLAEVEAALIDAYKGVLGFDDITADKNFFALGGDSLKAISLVAKLRNLLDIKVDILNLFNHPTPKALSQHLSNNIELDFDKQTNIPCIKPVEIVRDYYPLSSAQSRMYTIYLLDKTTTAYNLPSATIIKGKFSKEQLEKTLARLIECHEPLRTAFVVRDNKPVQVIFETVEVPLTYCEKAISSDTELDELIYDFIKPFALEKAPLFRVKLIKVAEDYYVMLLDVHHIVSDGTGMEIFSRDFNLLQEGEILKPKLQYKDFAVWQNEYLKSEELKQQKNYWLNYLGDDLPILELPTDFPRPRVRNYEGSRCYFVIDKELTAKITNLVHELGVTTYMLMLSVWNILLARYSGQEDIIVGTPVMGRTLNEVDEMFGMFVNMLAMRNRPDNSKRFIDFIEEVKTNALNAFKNQDYQFETLIQDLNFKRTLDRTALFDACFDFQNMEFYDFSIKGMTFTPYQFKIKTAIYDLLLTCQENKTNQTIDAFIEYSTRLFKEETIIKMFNHFLMIINNVLLNKEIIIGNIDILLPEEKELIFSKFNNTKVPVDDSLFIQDLFEENAKKYPDKVALIVASGKEFTYRELNEMANSLAWHLIDLGVVKDTLVGVIPRRDEYLMVALIGILKAGGAYVPIDFELPKDRIEYILSTSNIKLLICPEENRSRVDFCGTLIDCKTLLDHKKKLINPQKGVKDNLACVLFTSGSTGKPKGVMIKQSGVVNFIHDVINRKFYHSANERIISVTTISFDIFSFESIVPLCIGHTIYLADENEQLDPVLAGQKIIANKITHILSTVSRIKAFIANPDFDSALKQLKCIVSGAENYPLEMLQELQERSTARLYNIYGPTETTIWSTVKDLTNSATVNIGQPIANTEIYIINSMGQLQPIGIYGELCIAGAGVARGYLNNSAETSKRFVQFANIGNKKYYRTGDRARFLPNGDLQLSGRFDNQIKIRGYRIELDEIEKVALLNDNLYQAMVKVCEDEKIGNRLVIYYCLKQNINNIALDSDWLKDWLRERLPHYMMPAYFILLDEMPLLPNGKINRKALILPQAPAKIEKKLNVAVPSSLERDILAIWKEVLGTDDITIYDNFFDVGGNSLGLIYINNKLNSTLGYSIPLLQLFSYSTVESLAKSLCANKPRNKENNVVESNLAISNTESHDIAVIGLAGKFPGADNINAFWENIVSGFESTTTFSDEELLQSGINKDLLHNPNYVKTKGFLKNTEYFDSEFFKYSPQEAKIMDPQLRILHECVWQVLENAGCDPFTYPGKIGLFAGSSSNLEWLFKITNKQQNLMDAYEAVTLNDKDYLTTRISYKLNLKGPSFNVQTACSTSLVAIHQAVQALLNGEADLAIAGGVALSFPRKEGYLWHEGMIFAKDGHCRPFDADSSGIVTGDGCAAVLLKPLATALRDGNNIYAVIKGSAINNDGISKIGFTAPSISGQATVIAAALKQANILPEDIIYLETHGTGTKLGDPIEIEALKQAWNTDKKGFCAIGSVKANIGHLDAAAGVTGFIKAVLTLYHRTLPPLINFKNPNPRIDFANSPFYINTEAERIKDRNKKIKAGVSSFGIGGTNAHVILEEAPQVTSSSSESKVNLLVFSARSAEALAKTSRTVMEYVNNNPNLNLSDVAWTLQTGRAAFEYRKSLVFDRSMLGDDNKLSNFYSHPATKVSDFKKPIIFIFSNAIDQNLKVFQQLYALGNDSKLSEIFVINIENIFSLLTEEEHKQLLMLITTQDATSKLISGMHKQLLSFAFDYAFAKTLLEIGIIPNYLIGEGVGELTAAAFSNSLDLATIIEVIKLNYLEIPKLDIGEVLGIVENNSTYKLDVPQIPILNKNIRVVLKGKDAIYVEISLTENVAMNMLQQHLGKDSQQIVLKLLPYDKVNDILINLSQILGNLWCEGIDINWQLLKGSACRKILSLPSYVFDKKYFENDIGKDIAEHQDVVAEDIISKQNSNNSSQHVDDDLQTTLMKIWCKVLGYESINTEDDFFNLGGNSLKAISLAAQVQKELNIEIGLSEIFSNAIFSKMTKLLLSKIGTHEKAFSSIKPLPKLDYYPVSSAQKRMYALHKMLGSSIAYNFAIAQLALGSIDKNKFKNVIDALVQRHEAFRTSFAIVNNELVQVVSENVPSVVEFMDIAETAVDDEIAKYFIPFDLAVAPLFRVKLLSITPTRHVLLLDMHHIISDQTSIAIFLKDFADIYLGKPIKPLSLQYKDFAAWQNEMLKSQEVKNQYAYWQQEFSGEIPVINFPTDYVRPSVRSFVGDKVELAFAEDLNSKINNFAKATGFTRYMIFMAALKLILWKYSGQKDLIVGTAVAGRNHTDLDAIIGMFINTLAIRSQLDSELTVTEYLSYIKSKMIKAYENQDCQFEILLDMLALEKDLSRNPLFDVGINYVDMGTEDLSMEGVIFKPWPIKRIDARLDITLTIEDRNNKYFTDVEYNTSLYKRKTMEVFLNRFHDLIAYIVTNPQVKLSAISLLTEIDKQHLFFDWNNSKSFSQEKTLLDLFNEQLLSNKTAIALSDKDQQLTYEELDQRANQLAHYLIKIYLQNFKRTITANDLIGIYMERCADAVIATLAILKAGAAYLPLDNTYPSERIQFIVDDANVNILITHDYSNNKALIFATEKIKIINLNAISNEIQNKNKGAPKSNIKPSALAYVMYTSGSTGKPKGVEVLHRGIVRLVKETNYFKVTKNERFAHVSKISFDPATLEIWGALLNGAHLLCIDNDTLLNREIFKKELVKRKLDILVLTTAIFERYALEDASLFSKLKYLIVGGEAMSPKAANKVLCCVQGKPQHIINVYGPTENTSISTTYEVNSANDTERSIPIGSFINGTYGYVMSENFELQPPGIVGELFVGGIGVARGYLNRNELTKEKFIENPFLSADELLKKKNHGEETRLYRTGDLVRWTYDGVLEFIGRSDFQVKIRGFRIEIGEIENQIKNIPGIKEVVVIANKKVDGNAYLSAYYTLHQDSNELSAEYLRRYLNDKIPDYMIPSRFMQLSFIPLDANGKLDRKALPPIESSETSVVGFTSPTSDIQALILKKMQSVLNQNAFGPTDNFFGFGGDSIKAVVLVQSLIQEKGITISINDIFRNPTAKELANICEPRIFRDKVSVNNVTTTIKEPIALKEQQIDSLVMHVTNSWALVSNIIVAENIVNRFPLSPVQQMTRKSKLIHSGFTFKIDCDIEESSCRMLFANIIQDNQLLHSAILNDKKLLWHEFEINGILSLIANNIPYLDLREYDEKTQKNVIEKLNFFILLSEYSKNSLPYRLCCLRLTKDAHLIIWGFDHVAFDGMSAEIIRHQLENRLNALIRKDNNSDARVELAQKYHDYVELLSQGPNDITEKEIISVFSLKEWSLQNNILMEKLNTMPKFTASELDISIPLTVNNITNTWISAFEFVVKLLRKYVGINDIPLAIFNYGRKYGNNNFYNCLGEFLDIVPIFLPASSSSNIDKLLKLCQINSVNFLSLIYNSNLAQRFSKINKLLLPFYKATNKPKDIILFNFQGFVSQELKDAFNNPAANSQDAKLAKILINASYDENNLNINIDVPRGLNIDVIENLSFLKKTKAKIGIKS